VRSLCGVDTTGLSASPPRLPVGLACRGRSSEHVGENEMNLLAGAILFGRDFDLKVCPIHWSGFRIQEGATYLPTKSRIQKESNTNQHR